jgi:hypothetical protein
LTTTLDNSTQFPPRHTELLRNVSQGIVLELDHDFSQKDWRFTQIPFYIYFLFNFFGQLLQVEPFAENVRKENYNIVICWRSWKFRSLYPQAFVKTANSVRLFSTSIVGGLSIAMP